MQLTPEILQSFTLMRTPSGKPTVAGCLWLLQATDWKWEGRGTTGGARTYIMLDPDGVPCHLTTHGLRLAALTELVNRGGSLPQAKFLAPTKNSETSAGQSASARVESTP